MPAQAMASTLLLLWAKSLPQSYCHRSPPLDAADNPATFGYLPRALASPLPWCLQSRSRDPDLLSHVLDRCIAKARCAGHMHCTANWGETSFPAVVKSNDRLLWTDILCDLSAWS